MALSHFTLWLRGCGDALVNRCAMKIERRRLRRAEALLSRTTREKAAFWRTLYLARDARLQREREARRQARSNSALPARDISKADVLAAVARSRARREERVKALREDRQN
ncbi:MAG TPA: hypothetical protein VFP88_07115 [Rhodanobacteraceae bacterium]|nr:hypothetical protein [Rhodanobacteraceae bacterium]